MIDEPLRLYLRMEPRYLQRGFYLKTRKKFPRLAR